MAGAIGTVFRPMPGRRQWLLASPAPCGVTTRWLTQAQHGNWFPEGAAERAGQRARHFCEACWGLLAEVCQRSAQVWGEGTDGTCCGSIFGTACEWGSEGRKQTVGK